MLRLRIRGEAVGAAQTAPRSDDAAHRPAVAPETSQSFAILADRMTVESKSGRLSLWHADELVFRLPVSALLSIAFEVHDDPRPIPAAGFPLRRSNASPAAHTAPAPPAPAVVDHLDGPHTEAHHDLPSANTRWTSADERRLLELHAAGVPIDALARTFGRRKGAVRARLFKLRHAQEPGPQTPADRADAPPTRGAAEDVAG